MAKASKDPTTAEAVRFAIPLLVALTAVALVACDSGDVGTASPVPQDSGDTGAASSVPLAQRFLTAADAPGTKPDPVETRQMTVEFDEFVATLSDLAIDPDEEEVTKVFQAGFKGAGTDARFYGKTHSRTAPHVFSALIEFDSEDKAKGALDWLEADSLKPCPMSCAVQWSNFDVDDIPDGRGVHRLATAQLIKTNGTADEHPFDSYWVGFTEGSTVYTVDVHGPPGSVSEEQALKIARAYHDRLAAM
jgi:hypothetical protein